MRSRGTDRVFPPDILLHTDIRHILGDEEATASQVVPPVLGGALTPQIVPPFSSGEQVLRRGYSLEDSPFFNTLSDHDGRATPLMRSTTTTYGRHTIRLSFHHDRSMY